MTSYAHIQTALADQAESLLDHSCTTIPRDQLHLPGPDFIQRVTSQTDRSPMADGVKILNAIQDVYLCDDVTVA